MLFQEDIQKELLEKNNRREGPLFEGDESLLWSKKNLIMIANLTALKMNLKKLC